MCEMEWLIGVHTDARAAFLLALTEKVIDQIDLEEGYQKARETLNMCWDWVEEKKHQGSDLYHMLENEEATGVAIYIQFTDDSQQEAIWFCTVYAIVYTIWQAYKYENQKYMPQPIELIDDDAINEFMAEIREIHGFQEIWVDGLKRYLLEYHSLTSVDKKIRRREILSLLQ